MAAHVVLGTVVLALASVFVGFGGYFFIDEAAMYGQLEVMEERGSWTVPRPFPDRDPDAAHGPMARSDIAGDRYAPFAKHPVHVVIARGAHLVGGEVGVRLLSSLGLVGAATGAALLAGSAPRRRAVAFWVTLAGSPLLFDANLVVAHTLGAAVAAAMFVVAVRRPVRWWSIPTVGVLACLGGLLRNEFLLLAAAGFLVVMLNGLRRRSRPDAAVAVAMLAGGVAAYRLEPVLVRWAIGGSAGPPGAPTADSPVTDVVAAASRSLFEVNGSPATTRGILGLVLGATLVAVTAAILGRRTPDPKLAAVTGAGALVGAVLFASSPHLVTGLVWAFPAVLLLTGLAAGPITVDARLLAPLATAGVFAVFVAATQYSEGGGLEWGWRYVALAVPLVAPAVAGVLVQLWDRRPDISRFALVSVSAAAVLVQVGGLRVQRTIVTDTEQFLQRVDEVSQAADADWVLSLDASFGRFAYDLSTAGQVATASDGTGGEVLGWLRDDGVDTVLVVWRFDEQVPLDDLAGYRSTGDEWYLASGYRAILLREPS